MYKIFAIASAAMLIAAPASATSTPEKKPKAQKETVYCIAYEKTTGSRIEKSECKTKKEWAQERVNVDDLTKS